MKKLTIAFLDSGVGGLSTLLYFSRRLSGQRFLYFGDNKNAPYGQKSLEELKKITIENLTYVLSFFPNAIIIACNTLSLNLRFFIEDFCKNKAKVYFIFPPVEKLICNNKKVLLLSTPLSARYYKNQKNLEVLPLENLAKKIENIAFFNNDICQDAFLEERRLIYFASKKLCKNLNEKHVVVLGCTHYFFAKNQILGHKKPQQTLEGSIFALKKFLEDNVQLKKPKKHRKNQVIFIGKNSIFNKLFLLKVVFKNKKLKKNLKIL